jgi:hypothetical protein
VLKWMACHVGPCIAALSYWRPKTRELTMGKDGAGARSTRFVRDNLALLGFGGRKDALVQAVKELFENGARGGEQGHWGGG